VSRLRAALVVLAAGAVALASVSGGSRADPRTPAAIRGLPPPFLGVAVLGGGGVTAALDAYGDVADLRAPGPAGAALIANPADRQVAGTVPATTGIVPRIGVDGGAAAFWQADSVTQHYLPGTNVMRTVARFGAATATLTGAASGGSLAQILEVGDRRGPPAAATFEVHLEPPGRCERARWPGGTALLCAASPRRPDQRQHARVRAHAEWLVRAAVAADRRWIAGARPIGAAAPPWAARLYRRSLLTLRALTDRRTGAVAAGIRDGWAYVWPRDAGATALALAASGYRPEARRVARFLLGLDLGAAARFHGDGTPVAGRVAQGDASGWVAAAARATGLRPAPALPWRDRADYREGEAGDYLANAIAAGRPAARFASPRGLTRLAADPAAGLDSAAAWAVRPFPQPALFPAVRRGLLRLAASRTRFGITPGEGWPGVDPWTAPTAWSAWSLAALDQRRQALELLGDLRRAATPAGDLPERVDARSGIPRSTTPLAWSHAFAILALRQLWPSRGA
jgi:hypothetical protein